MLGRLSGEQLRETATDAIAAMERELPTVAQPLRGDEMSDGRWQGAQGAIPDTFLSDHLEAQLFRRDEIAAVLYALATRGRSDQRGRPGWRDAAELLAWLKRLGKFVGAVPAVASTPVTRWSAPSIGAPQPGHVIEQRVGDRGQQWSQTEYEHDRFVQSIERALQGRRAYRADLVAEWVLWGLAGQPKVLAGQLAAGLLDCLRRVDDLAYLRAVIWTKHLDTLTDVISEAVNMLQSPSSRLVINTQRAGAAVRPHDTIPAGQPT